jgi:cobalt-zinc-cadmium efflux system membrane fusion protein
MTNRVFRGTPLRAAAPLAAATMLALLPVTGCSPAPDRNAAPSATAANVRLTPEQRRHIQLYTVARLPFRRTIDTSGVVDFDNDQATSVLAPFSGPVARLLVAPGDRVKKGAPLAVVDSPDFAAALSAYRKALATAQTARRLADLDADLLAHRGVSERENAQAQTDAANAEADRDAALQALVSLDIDPKTIQAIKDGKPVGRIEGIIRSPIGGTVVEKLITPGQLLQAGATACFTVADLSRMWVMAQLFGSDVAAVGLGDTADVETGIGAAKLPGKVDNVAAQVDPNTRSVAVRVVVQNPGGILKKQMYVRAVIHARRQSSGLLVPVSAILRDDDNLPFLYVAQRDGSFARRHVTLGYRTGQRYDISAGLKAGERIVADGAIFMQFMQSQ